MVIGITLMSCNKKSETVEKQKIPIENLKIDTRLLELIDINIAITSNVVDKNVAKNILKKEYINADDLNELSLALGFKNSVDLQNLLYKQNGLIREIDADYDFKNYDENFKKSIISESISIRDNKKQLLLLQNNCERIRVNCILTVAAEATLMHFACASVDWTGIGAPICHGAAILFQIVSGDTCNANAEDCQGANAV
jgi:hypothetical protein